MYRRVAFLLLALLVYASPQFGHPEPPLERAISLYRHADYLFHLNTATPATDSAALAAFDGVLELLQPLPGSKERDTLYPFACLKKGILLDAAANYTPALAAYRRAMDFHPQDDSLSFVAKVYAGAVYYNLNNFDSADYFLQKAEAMAPAYRNPDDEVRLYNTLGVLYYDNGNYQQGRNYFNQALRLVESKQPFDTVSAVHLQTNIATCFYRLDQYEEALALYKKMLGYRRELHFVYINMGRTYAALGRNAEAMACFRRVDAKKVPAVWNEMAATQRQLQHPDSCLWYLDKLNRNEANKQDLGINQLYRADCYIDRKEYKEALACLEQSILIFKGSHFRLFDALLKKAQVYAKISQLEPAYQAYNEALSLLRYIEKSYDTDDAKLFLKKKSAGAYDGAITVCLQMKRTEQAFLISERSKATIVLANLRENSAGVDGQVL
ncbi:MAG TPA: tetratricopeptide repeat protein, partial [Puia sp.]